MAGPIGSRSASARRPPRGSGPHEALDIKDPLGVQQVVERSAQLVGQGRQRLRLAQLRGQPLEETAEAFVLLGPEDGRLAESPLPPGVARLAVAPADTLAGRLLHGAAPT